MNGKSLKETCTPATISPAAPASKASHLTAVCCVGVCYGNAGPEPHGISVGSTHPHLYFLALFPIRAVMCWAVSELVRASVLQMGQKYLEKRSCLGVQLAVLNDPSGSRHPPRPGVCFWSSSRDCFALPWPYPKQGSVSLLPA